MPEGRLELRLLGTVPYGEAWALQRALAEHAGADYLLVLEHPATITAGRSASMEDLITLPADGTEVVRSDRGGQLTWHGPGQVVAYPVVTLPDDPGSGRRHVERLEDAAIAAITRISGGAITPGRVDGHPGVFALGGAVPVKLASVGVRVARNAAGLRRSQHGIALNVSCDLDGFAGIVACGAPGLPVASLASLGCEASMATARNVLVEELASRFGGVARSAEVTEAVRGKDVGIRPSRQGMLAEAGVDLGEVLEITERKPSWLRIPAAMGADFSATQRTVGDLGLVTVCEEAGCPNIFECWRDGTATFMVNGERCTRSCGFCLVDTRRPEPLDPSEPGRVAEAVERLGLSHAVVTCVARDDLLDGGAAAIAATIAAIRARTPGVAVEVLISDLKGSAEDLGRIIAAAPDVLNHNVETVARLQRAVRPQAGYARSLAVLARAAEAGLVAKSGIMVGLGETMAEVEATLADMAAVGVSIATVGQYLRPTRAHLPVHRYWTPEEFEAIAEAGRALGLAHVQSSPLTRSSYHARDAAEAAQPVVLRAR